MVRTEVPPASQTSHSRINPLISQVLDLDIPIRDMRLMDVALLGGSDTLAQLLVRDKALVMSMEHIRMIITSDKVSAGSCVATVCTLPAMRTSC